METIKAIAKMERDDVVLFLPEMGANRGTMVCFDGAHSEVTMSYYWGLRNPIPEDAEKVAAAVKRYENHGPYMPVQLVRRDSRKLCAIRWG